MLYEVFPRQVLDGFAFVSVGYLHNQSSTRTVSRHALIFHMSKYFAFTLKRRGGRKIP